MADTAGLETYTVTETSGSVHTITAEYVFNNEGELVFRTGSGRQGRVDAFFAPGQWSSAVRVKPKEAVNG